MRANPKMILAVCLIATTGAVAGCGGDEESEPAPQPEHASWGYSDADGPAEWGQLDPDYALCASGKTQSPIDNTGAESRPFPPISFDYAPEELTVENNGHAIEARVDTKQSSIRLNGTRYGLEQFHFHTPAEEKIAGRGFAASIHLVHESEAGQAAAIGLLVRKGPANPVIARLIDEIPDQADDENEVHGKVEVSKLLPADDQAFRYTGSLTTPPCTEGVIWTVYKTPITMSKAQLDAFRNAYPDNVRPIQPRNGRTIRLAPAGSPA